MSNRDEQDKDWSRENNSVLQREQKRLDTNQANAEAAEEMFKRVAKEALKDGATKQNLAQDFLQKFRGDQKPDQELINFLRKSQGGSFGGVNNKDYEPDPTGLETLPWEDE